MFDPKSLGNQYNFWTILKRIKNRGKHPLAFYLCRCVCGVERPRVPWEISDDFFCGLLLGNCYYCGAPPNPNRTGSIPANGVDRLLNDKGYVEGNVVSCCKICNLAKRSLTEQEFKDWIKRVYEHIYVDKPEKWCHPITGDAI